MAREKSAKLLTALPERFDPNFIENMDKRYALSQIVLARIEALESHRGGAECLSYVERSLIRRCVWLELITETYEQRFSQGQETDVGALTQLNNTLKGLYKDLGLKPVTRTVNRLHDVMRAAS
jgi:hypothetical protein